MTLGEWIPLYLTSYKQDTIKVNSYAMLKLAAEHIPQEMKEMELAAIMPMQLQRFYNEFAKTYSKSYMDKVHTLLKGLFAAAVDNDLCEKNPTNKIRLPRIRETPRENFDMA